MRDAAIAVLAAAVLLGGCAARPPARPQPDTAGPLPSAETIWTALAERRAALRALRALGKVRYTAAGESDAGRQVIVAERPDRLRLELLSPFGTVFVLTTADGRLSAWSREEETVYRGTASRQNLAQYAQVDLPVTTAVDLLLGTPPLRPMPDTVVSADGGAVQLWQDSGRTIQVGWFDAQLHPLRWEQRAPDGSVRVRARFDAYQTVDGVAVPTQLTIEMPTDQRRLELALSEPEVNPPLPASVFVLDAPRNSRIVDLDEGMP